MQLHVARSLTPCTLLSFPFQIVMCEIDRRVCDVSKEFFSGSMSTAFGDPRVQLVSISQFSAAITNALEGIACARRRCPHPLLPQLYMDAAIYMREHKAEFDCIIVDSSDPVGPAETLYTSSFYRDMHSALRAGGIVCTQGECQWLHLSLIAKVMSDARALYPVVDYGYSGVPTYPNGQIGYILGCKEARGGAALRTPTRPVPDEMAAALRYYSAEVHAAAFALPAFAHAELAAVRAPQAAPAAANFGATFWAGLAAGAAAAAAVAAAATLLAKRK